MNSRVYRYIKDEHEPREPRLYMRGVGFICEGCENYMTEKHRMASVMDAVPDERGGLVHLDCVVGFARITTTAVCSTKDVFRYKDGDSLSGRTLCLARMQATTDRLGITKAAEWPDGWPVDNEYLEFLLDWREYEDAMRELKQAGAEERRRRDNAKYGAARAAAEQRKIECEKYQA